MNDVRTVKNFKPSLRHRLEQAGMANNQRVGAVAGAVPEADWEHARCCFALG